MEQSSQHTAPPPSSTSQVHLSSQNPQGYWPWPSAGPGWGWMSPLTRMNNRKQLLPLLPGLMWVIHRCFKSLWTCMKSKPTPADSRTESGFGQRESNMKPSILLTSSKSTEKAWDSRSTRVKTVRQRNMVNSNGDLPMTLYLQGARMGGALSDRHCDFLASHSYEDTSWIQPKIHHFYPFEFSSCFHCFLSLVMH